MIQGINNIINNKRLSDMNDEKTIYDDEKTQYQSQDEEATQYDEAYERENDKSEETTSSEDKKPENGKKQSMWKKVAVGAGTGILLGAGATILSASAPIDHTEGDEGEGEQHPEWTDGEVPVATSVSDEMSFSEAFAAARTEVGSGGVFEWHGNIYSTFTEEEWNGMTAEQRDEYGSHFSWHSDASHDTASASHSSSGVGGLMVNSIAFFLILTFSSAKNPLMYALIPKRTPFLPDTTPYPPGVPYRIWILSDNASKVARSCSITRTLLPSSAKDLITLTAFSL